MEDKALNTNLMPENSPITQPGAMSGFQFDSGYERNSVDLGKIKNFNFSAGTGGTIQLGGTANGNGYLVVQDSSGSTIVSIDNNGVTITGGSVSIKNSAGTTILDGTGLVSSANFISDQTTQTSDIEVTNTSFADVSGLSLTTSNFPRSTKLFITSSITGYHMDFDGLLVCRFTYNGTALPPEFIGGGLQELTASLSYIYTAPSGVGTVRVQARQNNSPGTAYIAGSFLNTILNYVVLGS